MYASFVSSALYLYLPLEVTVRLADTSYTVSESDGFVSINVVREGLTSQTVSVTLTTTNGSALGEKSSHCCTIYNQTVFPMSKPGFVVIS